MEIIVLTKDGSLVVPCIALEIKGTSSIYGTVDDKINLQVLLGDYNTVEEAKMVLIDMVQHMTTAPTVPFRMPQDDKVKDIEDISEMIYVKKVDFKQAIKTMFSIYDSVRYDVKVRSSVEDIIRDIAAVNSDLAEEARKELMSKRLRY